MSPGIATLIIQREVAAKVIPAGLFQKTPIKRMAKLERTPGSPTAYEGIALAKR